MDPGRVAAGEFGAWLVAMRAALRGEADAQVPCGTCTACCRSRQFVHVEPDETGTLDVIPAELLFPAPGLPPGHMVLGYDSAGCCPMLVDGACSIYANRPRACRMFDCRLLAATGRVDDDRPLLAERVRSWEFSYADARTRAEADRIRSAGSLTAETP